MSSPRLLVAVLLFGWTVPSVAAQDSLVVPAEDPPSSLDVRVFRAIYGIEAPAFATVVRAANGSSRPIFLGAVPAVWVGTWVFGGEERDFRPAYRLTLTEAAAVGVVFGLKNVVRRPRPYDGLPDVVPRAQGHSSGLDPYSFPSGHAAVSFALATSASLSWSEWYVIAPAFLWAGAVSISRPWLGVHYPSDVLVGAVLGSGVALVIHALGPAITPPGLEPGGEEGDAALRPPPVFSFRLSF